MPALLSNAGIMSFSKKKMKLTVKSVSIKKIFCNSKTYTKCLFKIVFATF